MNVQQLIDSLETVKDKTKPIYAWTLDESELYIITDIDDTISDRVDINIGVPK